MSNEDVTNKVGLDHLDDETLAWIASQRDPRDADEMSEEAKIAFMELARRTDADRGIS